MSYNLNINTSDQAKRTKPLAALKKLLLIPALVILVLGLWMAVLSFRRPADLEPPQLVGVGQDQLAQPEQQQRVFGQLAFDAAILRHHGRKLGVAGHRPKR